MTGFTEPPRAPVILRCETTINGRAYVAQQLVPRRNWDQAGEDYRDFVKAELRRTLAERLVTELDPPIVVHVPDETEDALHRQALAELDEPDA